MTDMRKFVKKTDKPIWLKIYIQDYYIREYGEKKKRAEFLAHVYLKKKIQTSSMTPVLNLTSAGSNPCTHVPQFVMITNQRVQISLTILYFIIILLPFHDFFFLKNFG